MIANVVGDVKRFVNTRKVRSRQYFDETVKEGINDPVHALHVDTANQRSGPRAHLHEAALDYIGSAQLLSHMAGKPAG
jgi:hypothetical protein